MIPYALERRALYDGCYDACESVNDHIAHDNMHRSPKSLGRKDAQVEEADGSFCQGNCEFVQNLSCPECLRRNVRKVHRVEGLLSLGGDLPARPCERPLVEGLPTPCQSRGRRLCIAQSDGHEGSVLTRCNSLTTLLIPRPIEKTCGRHRISKVTFLRHIETRMKLGFRRQTYHGSNDGIVIFVQLATSGQPRSQTEGNEADSDEGEDDGDDSKIDTTAMELIVSWVYDSHLSNCCRRDSNLRGDLVLE